jgi:integrase
MRGTIRKRGATWEYQILIGIDETTGKKKFKSKGGFETKKKAEAACAEAISDVTNGKIVVNKDMTFGQFARYWLETKEGTVQESTFRCYQQRIRNYFIPEFKDVLLKDMTEMRIRRWAKTLFKKLPSSGHAVDVFKMLRQMLEKAKTKRLIVINPFEDIDTPQGERKKRSTWSQDEFNLFLQNAQHSIYFSAFYLALTTGMRQSEILGLKWDAVNFDNNTIAVRSSLEIRTRKLKDKLKTDASVRSVMVNQQVMNFLRKHRIEQSKLKLLLGSAWPDLDLVNTSELGTPIIARNMLRTFYAIRDRLGLKQISFHDFRHTHATTLLEEGLDLSIISDRLGHSSIQITKDIYAHVTSKLQKEAVSVLDRVLKV